MKSIIKLIFIVLFLVCLIDMPYGYYQLVRFVALLGFAYLAYLASEKENKAQMIIYIGLAILFQPLIKISLGRELWNIVDVMVSVYLLFTIWQDRNKKLLI